MKYDKMLLKISAYCIIKIRYNDKTDHIGIHLQITKRNKKWEKKQYKINYKEIQKIMHSLKINGCAICGYNKCDACLDFHHSNPKDKKFYITQNMCRKNKLIAEELNKCILLCANCHREIHIKEKKIL